MADKEPNIIRAKVTAATYINGVLHHPGEIATVNLDELGVDKLGKGDFTYEDASGKERTVKRNLTPGLAEVGDDDAGPPMVPVAAVAPHAPNAPNAQGIPPGSVHSGTGALIVPDAETGSHQLVGADATVLDKSGESLTPDKPVKGK